MIVTAFVISLAQKEWDFPLFSVVLQGYVMTLEALRNDAREATLNAYIHRLLT